MLSRSVVSRGIVGFVVRVSPVLLVAWGVGIYASREPIEPHASYRELEAAIVDSARASCTAKILAMGLQIDSLLTTRLTMPGTMVMAETSKGQVVCRAFQGVAHELTWEKTNTPVR